MRRSASGWRIEGRAVFFDGAPVGLDYSVDVDEAWLPASGTVDGFRDGVALVRTITRSNGRWLLGEAPVDALDDCPDLDFGFTPATNLIAVKRLKLKVGEAARTSSAWFDYATNTLGRLDQSYERLGDATFRYRAPAFGYDAILRVGADGFVDEYPALWVRRE